MPTIPQIRAAFIASIIGQTLDNAIAAGMAASLKWEIRVIREDAEWFMTTRDFRSRRIDVEIENGVVVGAV